MSDATALPAIADQNIQGEMANAVDDTDKHTPVPAPVPVVEHVPEQVTPTPDQGIEALTAMVGTLADSVGTLQNVVTGLMDKDERPAGVPWTHAGGHHD